MLEIENRRNKMDSRRKYNWKTRKIWENDSPERISAFCILKDNKYYDWSNEIWTDPISQHIIFISKKDVEMTASVVGGNVLEISHIEFIQK